MNTSAELYLSNQLCFPLYVASRLTTKLYTPYLKVLDITYPQYLVMLVLWENDMQTVKQIGDKLFLESNTLTPLLKRLEQKAYITRKRDTEDERAVLISLTKKGEELKEQAINIPNDIVGILKDFDISTEQLTDFKHTLLSLVDNLNKVI